MVLFSFTGCVWVYRIYQPIFDPLKKTNEDGSLNEQYCNKTVYTFAFWLITAAYIFLGLFTSCICCFSIVSVILKNEYWEVNNYQIDKQTFYHAYWSWLKKTSLWLFNIYAYKTPKIINVRNNWIKVSYNTITLNIYMSKIFCLCFIWYC